MTKPERSSVPNHIPDELVHRYSVEARQLVHASRQGTQRLQPPWRATGRLMAVALAIAGTAGLLGLLAASLLVGLVMFVILVLATVVTRAILARLTAPKR